MHKSNARRRRWWQRHSQQVYLFTANKYRLGQKQTELMNGLLDRWIDGRINERTNGWMDCTGRLFKQIDGWLYRLFAA